MKRYYFICCLCLLALCGCSNMKTFVYQNPITDGIEKGGLRDCQVIRDNGKWYLTGTCSPVHVGANPGVKLYKSDDLNHWTFDKLLIDRTKLDSSYWYIDRFWAPEIHVINGKYYLLFNSRNETKKYTHGRGTCVAVADNIEGPYTVLTQDKPFSKGIDINFFQDTDGKVYADWHEEDYIMCAEVDMKTMQPKNSYIALAPTNGSWDLAGIEGSYMMKDKNTYYLFYSSWLRGYEIGYATSDSPMGPWTKSPDNPIYGAQDPGACQRYGGTYSGDPKNPFLRVGHNNVFIGPDGGYWLSCHGIVKGKGPMLVIEPFKIKNGRIIIGKPSVKAKKVRYKENKN